MDISNISHEQLIILFIIIGVALMAGTFLRNKYK